MYHGFYGNGWATGAGFPGFPWGGLIMGLVLLGLAAFAAVAFVRSGRALSRSTRSSGLDILSQRFARGEIDAETFRTMRIELEK